ncbi:MAG: DUF3540 domain-containing protein [Planctomycetota bacterium]|jgi:hypothetical protein
MIATRNDTAIVERVTSDRMRVRVANGPVDARWALPGLPLPAPGDEVVLTGTNDLYVVGVITNGARRITATRDSPVSVFDEEGELLFEYSGRRARVRVRGDLELVSERGTVRIVGDRVELEARHTLTTTARTIVTRARNAYQAVEKLSQLVAGRMRTLVSGALQMKAKDTSIKSDRDTRIDGEQIHLG